MTKQLNLMHIDGTSTLGNMLGLAKSFIFRLQPVVPTNVVSTKKVAPTLPKRKGSAIAAVLAMMLSGKDVNCIDVADALGSSRLKDHISNLRKRYGWDAIESMPVAIPTADGRVQWVLQYWLPLRVISSHSSEETQNWINEVRSIRSSKKADYKGAEIRARRFNLKKLNQRLDAIEARMLDDRGRA